MCIFAGANSIHSRLPAHIFLMNMHTDMKYASEGKGILIRKILTFWRNGYNDMEEHETCFLLILIIVWGSYRFTSLIKMAVF
jgi:hypothetical protein